MALKTSHSATYAGTGNHLFLKGNLSSCHANQACAYMLALLAQQMGIRSGSAPLSTSLMYL
eukprot:scaffold80144_cov13-Tisochrysis_lutea.AAC.1